MSYKNYADKVLNESTLRDKIDDILDEVSKDRRFHMPESRRAIVKEVLGEFENMKKKDILKLKEIVQDKLKSGDKKLAAIYSKVRDMDNEVLEVLEVLDDLAEKFAKILESGRTGDPSIQKFTQEVITALAGFDDKEIRTAVKLENEIANALK
jgi:type II secretory pathway predicted ATPase ExeA